MAHQPVNFLAKTTYLFCFALLPGIAFTLIEPHFVDASTYY